MELRILGLTLTNFKGIKHLCIDAGGEDIVVRGANGTGKTTIMDAWQWLLFGKDSTDRTQFCVKPQDAHGHEVHHLETSVGARLFIDGSEHSVVRTLAENWQKKRGTDITTFTGNVTTYLIDGVPRQAKEFEAWVNGLVSADLFKLLSNPLHFCTKMSWQERRKVLLDMVDTTGLSPMDIALGNEEYRPVVDVLGTLSVEDARKKLGREINEMEKERTEIPTRIHELSTTMALVDEYALLEAKTGEAACANELAAVEQTLTDAQGTAKKLSAIYAKISEIEAAKQRKAQQARQEADGANAGVRNKLETARRMLTQATASRLEYDAKLAAVESSLEEKEPEVIHLRAEYERLQETPVEVDDSELTTVCAVCEQAMPAHMVDGMRDRLLEQRRLEKSNALQELAERGARLSGEVERLRDEAQIYKNNMAKAAGDETQYAAMVPELEAIAATPVEAPEVSFAVEDRQIETLKQQAQELTAVDTQAIAAKRAAINERLAGHRRVIAQAESAQGVRNRIAQLEARKAEIGALMSEKEGQIFLLEKLTSERCKLLEARVNAMFAGVQWRLFTTQINGGIVDACDAMIDGVPFSDANNAAKINAGLEIINRLCDVHRVSVPVFIDNAESVNALYRLPGQMVTLVVTYDETLRINDTPAACVA